MNTTENRSVTAHDSPEASTAAVPSIFQSSPAVPEEPVIKIRPRASGLGTDLHDVWAHRELFFFLIWRDLKVRYRQTVLGAAWVVLQPILTTIVFTIFLSKVVRISSDGVPYPIFAYAGLLTWTFFSNAVSSGAYSIITSAHMISKVYFARLILPGAAIVVRLVDFIVASIILAILMAYYQITPTWHMLMFPVLVAQVTMLAAGVGIWASALNVQYRDVGTILPVLLQLWMFASPVVYSAGLVSENWRWVYFMNPLAGIMEGVRAALFGLAFNWSGIILSAGISLAVFFFSIRAFRRMEEAFADVI
jgi:lipopolysaccharide transport system permease protein